MNKYQHKGTVHVFGKKPDGGGNAAGWIIGIVVFLIILAAA